MLQDKESFGTTGASAYDEIVFIAHLSRRYDTGNLVADLDDTTSLTYMNLRVQPPAAR